MVRAGIVAKLGLNLRLLGLGLGLRLGLGLKRDLHGDGDLLLHATLLSTLLAALSPLLRLALPRLARREQPVPDPAQPPRRKGGSALLRLLDLHRVKGSSLLEAVSLVVRCGGLREHPRQWIGSQWPGLSSSVVGVERAKEAHHQLFLELVTAVAR